MELNTLYRCGLKRGRNQRDEALIIDGLTVARKTDTVGSSNVTISNVAPANVTTATISRWLQLYTPDGTLYYIPMWT